MKYYGLSTEITRYTISASTSSYFFVTESASCDIVYLFINSQILHLLIEKLDSYISYFTLYIIQLYYI